jgi:hypothetical protein
MFLSTDTILREQLISLLFDENAHKNFESAIRDFPAEQINQHANNILYSPWQLLEHIRIAQWDIVEFMINSKHISPKFPDGYWPDMNHQATWTDWSKTAVSIQNDLEKVKDLVRDDTIDLVSEIPHAPGFTYLREILLIADHNAYHVGGLISIRRTLGIW